MNNKEKMSLRCRAVEKSANGKIKFWIGHYDKKDDAEYPWASVSRFEETSV